MNKADYLAQVEALHASPELRARIAELAGTVRPRRRLYRPWMGVCACLALAVGLGVGLFTGRIPLPGGSGGGGAGHSDDAVAVGYGGHVAGVFQDGLADLRSLLGEIPHGGILLKNDLAVPLRINLQRVALADAEGAADFLGNDHAA